MGAQSKDTQLRVERIMRSKMYVCGDPFSAAHMYTQLAGETKDSVKYALEWMSERGLLIKRTDTSMNLQYCRPPRSLASVNWRKNAHIYEKVEQYARWWR